MNIYQFVLAILSKLSYIFKYNQIVTIPFIAYQLTKQIRFQIKYTNQLNILKEFVNINKINSGIIDQNKNDFKVLGKWVIDSRTKIREFEYKLKESLIKQSQHIMESLESIDEEMTDNVLVTLYAQSVVAFKYVQIFQKICEFIIKNKQSNQQNESVSSNINNINYQMINQLKNLNPDFILKSTKQKQFQTFTETNIKIPEIQRLYINSIIETEQLNLFNKMQLINIGTLMQQQLKFVFDELITFYNNIEQFFDVKKVDIPKVKDWNIIINYFFSDTKIKDILVFEYEKNLEILKTFHDNQI